MKIIVLGAGLVGRPMALDLAGDSGLQVTVADKNETALREIAAACRAETRCADLSDTNLLREIIEPYDLVLDAVPGHLGFATFRTAIECGKNIVDIAFFPEDPFSLDQLAREKGVTALMDMGVAPGMSNVLAAYAARQLERVDRIAIYVGGLPRVRTKPYEYKAVFSPIDVIEEYTRPARFVRQGRPVVMPALTEPELLEFEGVGTLEAFNSDGLRSLFTTLKAPDMIEKTLRYPGHIALMKVLRDTGFFSTEETEVCGIKIRPLDLTTALLFPQWKLEKGEEDLTVMQIIVEGERDGRQFRYTYHLLDYYDRDSGVHSMARTTGYAATAAVRLLLRRKFTAAGVIVPEYLSQHDECVQFLLDQQQGRGVNYRFEVTELS